jgi:hypothetical protein
MKIFSYNVINLHDGTGEQLIIFLSEKNYLGFHAYLNPSFYIGLSGELFNNKILYGSIKKKAKITKRI